MSHALIFIAAILTDFHDPCIRKYVKYIEGRTQFEVYTNIVEDDKGDEIDILHILNVLIWLPKQA